MPGRLGVDRDVVSGLEPQIALDAEAERARQSACAWGGSGSWITTRASWQASASLGGSHQSSTLATEGRQGRSAAGGGVRSSPASRARNQSPKDGLGAGSAAMVR